MKKTLMLAAMAATLVACSGGKSGGKPNFADNEYAVRTVATQSTELQTAYPATSVAAIAANINVFFILLPI